LLIVAYADHRAVHERLLPFCGSARTLPYRFVFLEGVKTALTADAAFDRGRYDEPPTTRLEATRKSLRRMETSFRSSIGRVYTWSNATRRWFAETPCAWPKVPCTGGRQAVLSICAFRAEGSDVSRDEPIFASLQRCHRTVTENDLEFFPFTERRISLSSTSTETPWPPATARWMHTSTPQRGGFFG